MNELIRRQILRLQTSRGTLRFETARGNISRMLQRATARTSSSMVKLGEAFTKAAQMTPKQARELAEQEMKIKRQMINSLQIPRFR